MMMIALVTRRSYPFCRRFRSTMCHHCNDHKCENNNNHNSNDEVSITRCDLQTIPQLWVYQWQAMWRSVVHWNSPKYDEHQHLWVQFPLRRPLGEPWTIPTTIRPWASWRHHKGFANSCRREGEPIALLHNHLKSLVMGEGSFRRVVLYLYTCRPLMRLV